MAFDAAVSGRVLNEDGAVSTGLEIAIERIRDTAARAEYRYFVRMGRGGVVVPSATGREPWGKEAAEYQEVLAGLRRRSAVGRPFRRPSLRGRSAVRPRPAARACESPRGVKRCPRRGVDARAATAAPGVGPEATAMTLEQLDSILGGQRDMPTETAESRHEWAPIGPLFRDMSAVLADVIERSVVVIRRHS